MATRKSGRRRARKGAKAELIRSMPGATPAQVVRAAARRRLRLTEAYVSSLRSYDRRSSTRSSSSREADLRRGFALAGLAKARQLMAEVEAAILG